MDLMPLALIGTASAFVYVFVWRLGRERREVENRGVNQHAAVTLGRALTYTAYRVALYAALAYALVAGYYFVHWRGTCQETPERQDVYAQDSVTGHLIEALTWPQHYRDGSICEP